MRIDKNGGTLNTRVFETLRGDILAGKHLPEERLRVAALAHAHGVSPNVIREALNRLAGEVSPPALTTPPRPITVAEKIIAAHAIVDAKSGRLGVPALTAGAVARDQHAGRIELGRIATTIAETDLRRAHANFEAPADDGE